MNVDDDVLSQISATEALAVLSSFGFNFYDFRTIEKLGGAKAILAKGVSKAILAPRRFVIDAFRDLRRKFDHFYEQHGFLITPLHHSACRLFRNKFAPLAYFARFHEPILDETPMVAIVGARDASERGLEQTDELARTLARYEITVVSGGARGIDRAAHAGALRARGKTVVIAGQVASFSPRESLLTVLPHVAERGLIVYPFGPFLSQDKFMFVERNRYVAAMVDAVVVVEGRQGSGTLHTARFAEDCAVPLFSLNRMDHDDDLAYVPRTLMLEGKARVLANFEQFAEALMTKSTKPLKRRKIILNDRMRNPHKACSLPYLLQIISDHENNMGFDEIMAVSGLPYAQLQKDLLDYELNGRIVKRGSQFVLTGN